MSDPLTLLRHATMAGAQIVSENGNYVLGPVQLPELTSTAFKRTILGNAYYYTLKDIVVFLANSDLADADYRKKVIETRVTAVVGQDRQPLKSYLTGAIDTCPQIDHQVAASFQVPMPAQANSSSANEPTMSVEKMQEQRERFNAQMEKALQKTKTADQTQDAIGGLKQLKRKHASGAEGEGEDEVVDKQFLAADKQILARLRSDELPAHTRSTVLNATTTDFSIVLKLFNEKILKPMQPTKSVPAPTAPGSGRKPADPAAVAAVAAPVDPRAAATGADPRAAPAPSSSSSFGKNYPIIILPGSLTTCITMINVKDFLLEGTYISVEEKRSAGAVKEREMLLIRDLPSGGGRLIYRVIDDPTKLSSAEWDLVVAVFATGQLWQFKGWKFPTPVALFQNVLGVHVCVDSAAVDANILSWNCRVLKINLFKQHLNAGAAREFWMYLDDYVKLRRPHLLPSNRPRPAQPAPGHHSSHSQHHQSSHSSQRASDSVPPAPQPVA